MYLYDGDIVNQLKSKGQDHQSKNINSYIEIRINGKN
jgi:hypothetical protein